MKNSHLVYAILAVATWTCLAQTDYTNAPPGSAAPTPTPRGSQYGSGRGSSSDPYGYSRRNSTTAEPYATPSTGRRSSSSSDRESSNRRRERGTAQTQDPNVRGRQSIAQPGKTTQHIRVQAAPPSQSKGSAEELAARFTAQIDRTLCILSLSPSYSYVPAGETFVTAIAFSNPQSRRVDRFFIELRYDRDALEPEGANVASLALLCAAPPEVAVDRGAGLVRIQGNLSAPLTRSEDNLASIRWKTFRRRPLANIEFSPATAATLQEADVLGRPDQAGDGTIGAQVDVGPAKNAEASGDEAADVIEPAELVARLAPEGGVKLALYGPAVAAPVGRDFYVDVWLENARLLPVDRIQCHLSFDPERIEVIDEEEGNWIINGVNVLDGPFHESYPFDLHVINQAYNSLGEIYYGVGLQTRRHLPEAGTFARIRFRSKAPGEARVNFVMPSGAKEFPTQVTYLGQDILGAIDDPDDGATGCVVRIVE